MNADTKALLKHLQSEPRTKKLVLRYRNDKAKVHELADHLAGDVEWDLAHAWLSVPAVHECKCLLSELMACTMRRIDYESIARALLQSASQKAGAI